MDEVEAMTLTNPNAIPSCSPTCDQEARVGDGAGTSVVPEQGLHEVDVPSMSQPRSVFSNPLGDGLITTEVAAVEDRGLDAFMHQVDVEPDDLASADPDHGLLSEMGEFRPSYIDRVPVRHYRRIRDMGRFFMGLPLDPGAATGSIQIFGVDEVISRMHLTPMEKNFLLTRWLKARNDQKYKSRRHARAFRTIGLVKVLCGVLVPVFVSSVSETSGVTSTALANASIIVSILGTLATALEDFFQFGVRAANRVTCLNKMDRAFWEFQGLSGRFASYSRCSGPAFRRFASLVEQFLFVAEETFVNTIGAAEEGQGGGDKKEEG